MKEEAPESGVSLPWRVLPCPALQFLFLSFSPSVKRVGSLLLECHVHGSHPNVVTENTVKEIIAGAASVRGLCLVGLSFLPFLGLIWEAEEGAFVKARLGAPGEEKWLPAGRLARGSPTFAVPRNPSFGPPNSVPVPLCVCVRETREKDVYAA